jgi:hypothetical protein
MHALAHAGGENDNVHRKSLKVMENSSTRSLRILAGKTLIVVLMLALAACSAVRIGYNHGETLTYWWLNSYVDVTADQKPWVKQRIARFFQWHRTTQLKDYAQLLAQTQKQVQRPVSTPELLATYEDARKRMLVVIDHALPDLADLALSLKPEQIARIEKKFASNNDDYRRDYLRGDVTERQRFRFKKVMEQAEYWFGDFSAGQEALIRKASDARILNNELWFAGRQARQRELIAMLRKIQAERPSRDATIEMLRAYATTMIEHAGGGENELFYNAARDGAAGVATVVINCTTPAQKARAVQRLQQWIDNFNALST